MARPLTGTRTDRDGRYSFACPPERGSRQRRQATFASVEERDAYAEAALRALEAGEPLPAADRFRRRQPGHRAMRDTSFKAMADGWYDQHYATLRRAGAERAVAVRRLLDDPLIPYFDARVATVEDLTQDLVIDFYADFRRRGGRAAPPAVAATAPAARPGPTDRRTPPAGRGVLPGGDRLWDVRELTLADAALLCRVSLSTVKRAVGPGGTIAARRDDSVGCRVVRVCDLAAAGLLRAPDDVVTADPRSVGYTRLAVDVLKSVCRYARANGLQVPDVTDGLRLVDDEPRTPQRALTWDECRRLATHLHPVWQVAFWLMRSLGLRISEAFGLRVEDILDLGDGGLVDVFRQGGRPFHAYGLGGQIVTVPDKRTPKTAASIRLIVACEPVLAMLRVVVAAFHTDPLTGEVDGRARLVPGLADAGRGGQAGFRAALAAAAVTEGLDSGTVDFRVSSHLLRKSLTTELAWDPALHESAKRHYVGQRAADDVFGRTYTLSHPHLAPTRAVAAAVNDDIERCLGGTLLVPTARRFTFRAGNVLQHRTDHAWAVLDEAGWTVTEGTPDDPLLDAGQVATELQVSVTTARRLMASGQLPCVPIRVPGKPTTRHARLSDILAARKQSAGHERLPDLAAQLHLGYHEARSMMLRIGLCPAQDAATGEYLLSADDSHALRTEADRIRQLHTRSVRLAHAAIELGTGVATVNALLRAGTLILDPDTDPAGAKYVTRSSVAVEKAARQAHQRPPLPNAATTLTLKQARAVTGLPERMLLSLSKAGHLQRCTHTGRGWAVTRASMAAWATAYRPDLLPQLTNATAELDATESPSDDVKRRSGHAFGPSRPPVQIARRD